MLHVGIYSPTLPSLGTATDGAARAAHDVAQGLALRGHDVRVWTFAHRPAEILYDYRQLPLAGFFRSTVGRALLPGFLSHVMSLVPDTRDRDVMLCFGDGLFLPLKHPRVGRVLHGSALAEARTASGWVGKLWARVRYVSELFEGLCYRTFRESRFLGASAVTKALNPYVGQIIPDGIDRTVFFPVPEERATEPWILFVGNIRGVTRGLQLLRWFHRVIRPQIPNARLTVVGPLGPKVPGVEYVGSVDPATLAKLYRRAWVFAIPSVYEASGVRYLEAMASGTPVVATPNPTSEEILGAGRFGLLAGDDNFAKSVSELLVDESLRRQWAEWGLRRAAEMDLAQTLTRYEDLLRAL